MQHLAVIHAHVLSLYISVRKREKERDLRKFRSRPLSVRVRHGSTAECGNNTTIAGSVTTERDAVTGTGSCGRLGTLILAHTEILPRRLPSLYRAPRSD
ncbi:hypothetical protein CEXT_131751 [Caerostris extrusa]|uniref:Uncharacterized protein n=1 Tax=Caerostris extrusa TaxID=172846 RepID=A0AAV4QPX1_CAEEX|nr:hypothetical protein CEXT_131751 [Caerostris extrusa]